MEILREKILKGWLLSEAHAESSDEICSAERARGGRRSTRRRFVEKGGLRGSLFPRASRVEPRGGDCVSFVSIQRATAGYRKTMKRYLAFGLQGVTPG